MTNLLCEIRPVQQNYCLMLIFMLIKTNTELYFSPFSSQVIFFFKLWGLKLLLLSKAKKMKKNNVRWRTWRYYYSNFSRFAVPFSKGVPRCEEHVLWYIIVPFLFISDLQIFYSKTKLNEHYLLVLSLSLVFVCYLGPLLISWSRDWQISMAFTWSI